MRNYIVAFLIMTLVTGLLGFVGINFAGIEVVRVLFLIFADLLIITVLSSFFFADSRKMILERVKK